MVIIVYESSVQEYQASDVKAHLKILKISINKEQSLTYINKFAPKSIVLATFISLSSNLLFVVLCLPLIVST